MGSQEHNFTATLSILHKESNCQLTSNTSIGVKSPYLVSQCSINHDVMIKP